MTFKLKISEGELEGNKNFKNEDGNHECAVFVQQAAGAPNVTIWKKGDNVMKSALGSILKGTVISTFDAQGHYPIEKGKKHAAVYISHSDNGIKVYDQWNDQGMVKSRTIHSDLKLLRKYVNRAENFFVVET
ncbi:MAG: BPSL0067 family protein [Bacteroidota bacterium]